MDTDQNICVLVHTGCGRLGCKKPETAKEQNTYGNQLQQYFKNGDGVLPKGHQLQEEIIDEISKKEDDQANHDQIDGGGNFSTHIFFLGTVVDNDGHEIKHKT